MGNKPKVDNMAVTLRPCKSIQQELFTRLLAYGFDVRPEYVYKFKLCEEYDCVCRFDLVLCNSGGIYCAVQAKRTRRAVERARTRKGIGTRQYRKYKASGIPVVWVSGEDDLAAVAERIYDEYGSKIGYGK